MKAGAMFIFLSIVLLVYSLVNTYIFVRGWQALSGAAALRPAYIAIYVIIFLSYIIGRILMNAAPGNWSNIMIWIGSFWLAFMLYFFLFIVLLDFIRVFNHWFHFLPSFITLHYETAKLFTLGTAIFLAGGLIAGGYINALFPRVKTISISIPKKAGKLRELNLVMASDVHLGNIVGRSRFSRMVETINSLKPDIVLFAGDLVDEDIEPVIRLNLGEMLLNIQSKYGVFAIPGNHEYIGGGEKAFAYLETHGVKVLCDTNIRIDSSFLLIGRDDRDRRRFSGTGRAEIVSLLGEEDKSQPVIMLDHQPFDFDKTVQAGVDLQLSGHTHVGQMWPFNYITHAIYETDYGYLKKGETQFYVSSGYGTWGPPVRIGNRPEIVQIRIMFAE